MFLVDFRAEDRTHLFHRVHLLHLVDDLLLALEVKVTHDEGLESASVYLLGNLRISVPTLTASAFSFAKQSQQEKVKDFLGGKLAA